MNHKSDAAGLGVGRKGIRSQFRLTNEWRTNLLYASPYLVFVGIPVYDLVARGQWDLRSFAVALLLMVMVASFIVVWLINKTAPRAPTVGITFWVPQAVLVGSILALVLIGGERSPGLVFMWAYAGTPWVLLAPKPLVASGAVLLAVAPIGTGMAAQVPPTLIMMATVVTFMSEMVVWTTRREIKGGRAAELRRATEYQLKLEHERSLINSNLHDVLGQDLTGVSIKADLAGRLLDAGQLEQARIEIKGVAELAREALSDVRAVVRSSREWSIDHELASAEDLLAARDVSFHLEREEVALTVGAQSAIARVIRESITNLLHHSAAENCWVTLTQSQVRIENDGFNRMLSERTRGAGQGLTSLGQLLERSGTLTWGPGNRGWLVTFTLSGEQS